eukprot:g27363.t1
MSVDKSPSEISSGRGSRFKIQDERMASPDQIAWKVVSEYLLSRPERCKACNTFIKKGEAVQALSVRWHRECLVCQHCLKPLALGSQYIEYKKDMACFCGETCLQKHHDSDLSSGVHSSSTSSVSRINSSSESRHSATMSSLAAAAKRPLPVSPVPPDQQTPPLMLGKAPLAAAEEDLNGSESQRLMQVEYQEAGKLASPAKEPLSDELFPENKLRMVEGDRKWAMEGEGHEGQVDAKHAAPANGSAGRSRAPNGADAHAMDYNTDLEGSGALRKEGKEGDCFMLHVKAIEIKKLPSVQPRTVFRPFLKEQQLANPYLLLELRSSRGKSQVQRFKSLPLKNTLNPFFNNTYTFVLKKMEGTLRITVQNHESFLHKGHLGNLSIDISSMDADGLREHTEGWYQLFSSEGQPNGAEMYLCLTKDIDRSAKSKGFKAMVEFERARERLIANFSAAAKSAADKGQAQDLLQRTAPEYPFFQSEAISIHENGEYNYLETYAAEYGDLDQKDFQELQRLQKLYGDTNDDTTGGTGGYVMTSAEKQARNGADLLSSFCSNCVTYPQHVELTTQPEHIGKF